MNSWDYEQAAPTLSDTKVDRLDEVQSGPIDELPTLSIDIPDYQIIKNLESRVQDSVGYWDDPGGFNLRNARSDNMRLYLGKQLDVRSLYRFQIPYIENQIYISEQAIIAYLTAETGRPECSPSEDSPQAKLFASDHEKILMAWSEKVGLIAQVESVVRNGLNKRLGILYFEYDPVLDEIMPISLNPEMVVVDKNAKRGENPEFVKRNLKMSVNEICNRWSNKQEAVYKECGIVRGTYKQLEEIINVSEVWLTYYDKQYQPHEAVVYYFGNLVLDKFKDPNWLHVSKNKNFLPFPKKPFLPLNFDNDGEHWIDQTSAVEQASNIQNILNKRGRQLMEVADKANGILVIDTASGVTKADGQDLTEDPNQKIFINSSGAPGKAGSELIFRLPPPEIPDFLFQDKLDQRTQIHAIMGTPSEFSGSSDGDPDSETLGEAMMKKNQASGRQDLYVRAIDRFMNEVFKFATQMMTVWYTDKHYFTYNGGDGQFDHLVISRSLMDNGIGVNVKSGTTLPFDKQRQEAIVLQLLKMGASISLLDAYKLLHMQNPQQLYDNWAKQQTDPMSLARDALDETDEAKAYIAYVEIMHGKTPKEPDDCTKEFVLTLRKLMLRDDFLKAKKPYINAFIKYVDKAVTSLELRTALDQMSQQGVQALEPSVPIQPFMPPAPMGMPGQPPMGGMPPQGSPVPMVPQPAPMGAPTPPPGNQPMLPQQGGNVTGGLPLPNPASPQVNPNTPGMMPPVV